MLVQNTHIIAIITPLLFGFLSFIIKDRKPQIYNIIYLTIFVLFFIFLSYGIFKLGLLNGKYYNIVIGGWSKAMGIEIKYNLNCAMILLFLCTLMIIFLTTIKNGEVSYAVRGFACIMLCGANGIVITNDIFNSYVFFEIICITTYIMYSHGKNISCLKNTYNYMILSGFTGVVFLLVAGFLYQITGNLNIDLINKNLAGLHANKAISASFVLFVLAMIFKLGVYPLHNIVLNVYKNLPIKYLIFTTGVSSIAYPYFIMKFITQLFGIEILSNNEYLSVVLKIFGGIGFLFFNSMALSSKKVIEFIISLSLAQTSLFAFCIPYLNQKSVINGIIFAISSNTLSKICLLAILLKIQTQLSINDLKKTDISNLSSLVYKTLFIILLFMIAGMPFSLVFMSKWYLLVGIFNSSNNLLWLFILITGFAVDMFACFMFIKQIFAKNENFLSIKTDYLFTSVISFAIFLLTFSAFFVGKFNKIL